VAHYLPLEERSDDTGSVRRPCAAAGAARSDEMADLRIFWGPEICRLEYLLHLMQTGRIKDEYLPRSA